MNDAELRKLASAGQPCMVQVDRGLYLRVSDAGTPFWVYRYSHAGKRRQLILGQYGKPPEGVSLRQARDLVAEKRSVVREGSDPLVEKQRGKLALLNTVDDVANDWLREVGRRLKFPKIPERVYRKDIAPHIGSLPVSKVTSRDILSLVRKIRDSGRKAIANDALVYCKNIFDHGIKLDLARYNPAHPIGIQDAGGFEEARSRVLTLAELKTLFDVCREQQAMFSRENYLAVALLVVLGVRKGELIAATWNEFDLEELIWHMPAERSKTGVGIRIPLPEPVIPWLLELKIRSNGQPYVFPARRASKRRGYISDDTLNHALAKLFGMKVGPSKESLRNWLGEAGLEHFVVHDLRRTCRTLLASNAVPEHVAERCLNHKIKGVKGIYDRYDYFDERKLALSGLAELIAPLVGSPPPEITALLGHVAP